MTQRNCGMLDQLDDTRVVSQRTNLKWWSKFEKRAANFTHYRHRRQIDVSTCRQQIIYARILRRLLSHNDVIKYVS